MSVSSRPRFFQKRKKERAPFCLGFVKNPKYNLTKESHEKRKSALSFGNKTTTKEYKLYYYKRDVYHHHHQKKKRKSSIRYAFTTTIDGGVFFASTTFVVVVSFFFAKFVGEKTKKEDEIR